MPLKELTHPETLTDGESGSQRAEISYPGLAIYARACDSCTGSRPCTKHRAIMAADESRQFAAQNGITLDEQSTIPVPLGEGPNALGRIAFSFVPVTTTTQQQSPQRHGARYGLAA